MADSCVLELMASSGTLSSKYLDESVNELFRVELDAASRNLPDILNRARAANPTQFPLRGQAWPASPFYGLYAKQFQFKPLGQLQKDWHITVDYLPLSPNEPDTEGTSDNPLLWPRVPFVDWIEYEEAITKAKNVQAFGVNTGPGERAALTMGLVTNSAHQQFDEGLFDSVRDAVFGLTWNVATINEVLAVQRDYARTCNSDTLLGVGPRRFKFIGVESAGRLIANGYSYFPLTVRVQLKKSTDSVVDNVGWHHWYEKDGVKKLAKYKVKEVDDDGNETGNFIDPAEPGRLSIGGLKAESTDDPVELAYRYLDEVPYAPLLI